jgi:hypothetical protein
MAIPAESTEKIGFRRRKAKALSYGYSGVSCVDVSPEVVEVSV